MKNGSPKSLASPFGLNTTPHVCWLISATPMTDLFLSKCSDFKLYINFYMDNTPVEIDFHV